MTDDEWIQLGEETIVEVLRTHSAVTIRELEARVSNRDRPGYGGYHIDPDFLGKARRRLEKSRLIESETAPTKGNHEVPTGPVNSHDWLTSSSTWIRWIDAAKRPETPFVVVQGLRDARRRETATRGLTLVFPTFSSTRERGGVMSGLGDSMHGLESIYGDWRLYNNLVIAAVRGMSSEELALRAPADDTNSSVSWPIWAIAGHTAAMRVYWLCHVMGVAGAEATPFQPGSDGWEDDLDHPRSAQELVNAWTTTWAIVERVLGSWTPAMLDESVARPGNEAAAHFTRRSVMLRIITHEAYHVGQISVIQGIHRRPQIDLWPPRYHTVEAATALGVR